MGSWLLNAKIRAPAKLANQNSVSKAHKYMVLHSTVLITLLAVHTSAGVPFSTPEHAQYYFLFPGFRTASE